MVWNEAVLSEHLLLAEQGNRPPNIGSLNITLAGIWRRPLTGIARRRRAGTL